MSLTKVEIEDHRSGVETRAELARAVAEGLTSRPKRLSPKWFYDEAGSALFEQITELDEYYPTRREREILDARASEIAAIQPVSTLIELGSGSSLKTRLLLDALKPATFVPFDVCEPAIREASESLNETYPEMRIRGICGDFESDLERLPDGEDRMVVFLGGTIGNLEPAPRSLFLEQLADQLRPGEALLLGADLVKDPARLELAYDDPHGVTSAFNLNVLARINRDLQACFELDRFEHVARWDPLNEWMRMTLRSTCDQLVPIPGAGIVARFREGEELQTEISAKFRREGLSVELAEAGFSEAGWWTDAAGDFSLSLWRRDRL